MSVEIRSTGSIKGKGLFATRDIKVNGVILEEDPLVCCQFSWNEHYKYKACDHCLRPLETAEENARRLTGKQDIILPYIECCTTNKAAISTCERCGVEYCSLECRSNAELQYHNTLCLGTIERTGCHPLELLNEAWKNMHYPPETNSVMLIVRLLARIIQSPNPQLAISETMQFCHRTVNEDAELAHKLLGDQYSKQITHLLMLLQQALPHETIQHFLTEERFKSLLALIGTNGQGIGTSAFSQWVSKASQFRPKAEEETLDKIIDKLYADMEAHSDFFWNNEGVGLFTLQSAANHSCSPNAEVTFPHNNSKLSLVAQQDIKAGEEIFISYLDSCGQEQSRHSRRKQLMENYLFSCDCTKCVEEADQPDVTSGEEEESEDEHMDE